MDCAGGEWLLGQQYTQKRVCGRHDAAGAFFLHIAFSTLFSGIGTDLVLFF